MIGNCELISEMKNVVHAYAFSQFNIIVNAIMQLKTQSETIKKLCSSISKTPK